MTQIQSETEHFVTWYLSLILDKEKGQVPSDDGEADFDDGSSAGTNNGLD